MKTSKKLIFIFLVLCAQLVTSCKDKVPDSTPESGLVALYNFDNNLNDQTVNGNNGIAFGGLYNLKTGNDYAYQFNGVDDYIKIYNTPSLNPEDGMTISVWFKPVNFKGIGWAPLLVKPYTINTAQYNQYFLGLNSNSDGTLTQSNFIAFSLNISGQNVTVIATSKWRNGEWFNVIGLYDGKAKVKIYVNGLLEYTFNTGGLSISSYDSDVFLAKSSTGGLTFSGEMDNIRIYDRGLTGPEVWDLYQKELTEFDE